MQRMRTTVDIPDELFRRAKSEAALRGRKLKDLVEEGLRFVLEKEKAPAKPSSEQKLPINPRPVRCTRRCKSSAASSKTDRKTKQAIPSTWTIMGDEDWRP